MIFEEELSKGNFLIPECKNCKKFVWPSVEFCNTCFGKISLKDGNFQGKIIEFSKQNKDYFCIVEIENSFRIMAKMIDKPYIDQIVRVSKCGISDGHYFFEVT